MKKFFVLLAVAALSLAAALPATAADRQWKALGLNLGTGLIQKNYEQPFFENFAEKTGVPINVTYSPLDVTGLKTEETLRVLKSGLFDVVALRAAQAARDDPFLLGPDLVGLCTDYDTARKVYGRYKDAYIKRVEDKFGAKLMGLWPFGPQVVFSRTELKSLDDFKGKKVRVYDQSLAQFVQSVGGIPVSVNFGEVQQALSRGVVDIAITGISSANTAGWPEVTKYLLPIGFQISFNGYAINKKAWDSLSKDEQEKIQAAFDKLNEEIWQYSETINEDALRCTTGQKPCETVREYNMTLLPVTDKDREVVRKGLVDISFPAWSAVCDKVDPTCSATWIELVGDIAGMK